MPRGAATFSSWSNAAGVPDGTRGRSPGGPVPSAPGPGPRHQRIAGRLTRFIGGPFDIDDDPGGWWILPSIEVELSPQVLVQPDLAGWRRALLPAFPDGHPVRIVPDWICEVLSASSKQYDMVTKADLYARFSVPFYWTVDPEERVLQASRWRDGSWVVLGAFTDGARARIPPFESVELDVSRFFLPKS